MAVNIRKPFPDEREEILNLLDECFKKTPRYYFEHYIEDGFPERAFVAVLNGEIVGYLQVYARRVRAKDGKTLTVGGIGNVCTRRDMRGRGIASRLLQHAHRWMVEEGYDFSILFASRHGFYTKNGWKLEPVYVYEFQLPADLKGEGMDFSEEFVRDIMMVSEEYNEEYTLTVVRNEKLWDFQLKYYSKVGVIRIDVKERFSYAIFKKLDEGIYQISDFAGNVNHFVSLIPSGARILRFFSKPYHELTEFLREKFPYTEAEHRLVYVRGVRLSPGELDELIFYNKWHFWEFDMF